MRAASTNEFLDSIGAITHLEYTDKSWGNFGIIPGMLSYIGVQNVRQAPPLDRTIGKMEVLADQGVDFTFIMRGPRLDIRESIDAIARLERAVPGSVAAIEGPNELNLFTYYYKGRKVDGNDMSIARDIHEEMRDVLESNPYINDVPIIGFSLGRSGPWTAAKQVGDISGLTDYSNWHSYYGGEQPRRKSLENVSWAQTLNKDPVVFTESGYHNALGVSWEGVDEATEAKMILNMLMDNFQIGVERTFIYSLMNDQVRPDPKYQEDNFGLFNGDGSPQKVAHALHNFNRILLDSDDYSDRFKTDSLDYKIEGLRQGTYHTLMQKEDGSFAIVVWAEPDIWDDQRDRPIKAPKIDLTLKLQGTFDVNFYDPLVGKTSLDFVDDVRTYDFAVVDHPVVIELLDTDRGRKPADGGDGKSGAGQEGDGSPVVVPDRGGSAGRDDDGAGGGRVDGRVDGSLFINLGGTSDVGRYERDLTGVGNKVGTFRDIAKTSDDALYRESVWGDKALRYDFAVADPGTYEITVHMAEIWDGSFSDGVRVFDIKAEGRTLGNDIDIFREVGARAALTKTYEVEVKDGILDLDFIGERQNPSVAGIAIEFLGGADAGKGSDGSTDSGGAGKDTGGSSGSGGGSSGSGGTGGSSGSSGTGGSSGSGGNGNGSGKAGKVVLAYNIGSDTAFTASDGTLYAADTTGSGRGYRVYNDIAGTEDDGLYQVEVWQQGKLTYDLPIANGRYEVELHFSEIYDKLSKKGARVFDIELEGERRESKLDVFAKVGADKALTRSFTVDVDDGVLDIDLIGRTENPTLSGLKVTEIVTSSQKPQPSADDVVMEFGSVKVDDGVVTVDLDHKFDDPVVLLTTGRAGSDKPTAARVVDVDGDSFRLYNQTPGYLKDDTSQTVINYLVVEEGTWALADGTLFQAGTVDTRVLNPKGWGDVDFNGKFDELPAILTTVQTDNDPTFVATRQRQPSKDGFELALMEQESTNWGSHGTETVGWLAIEQGDGLVDDHAFYAKLSGLSVDDEWQTLSLDGAAGSDPLVFANIATARGRDSSVLRTGSLTGEEVSFRILEDQSRDKETSHLDERVAMFAIDGAGQLSGTEVDSIF